MHAELSSWNTSRFLCFMIMAVLIGLCISYSRSLRNLASPAAVHAAATSASIVDFSFAFLSLPLTSLSFLSLVSLSLFSLSFLSLCSLSLFPFSFSLSPSLSLLFPAFSLYFLSFSFPPFLFSFLSFSLHDLLIILSFFLWLFLSLCYRLFLFFLSPFLSSITFSISFSFLSLFPIISPQVIGTGESTVLFYSCTVDSLVPIQTSIFCVRSTQYADQQALGPRPAPGAGCFASWFKPVDRVLLWAYPPWGGMLLHTSPITPTVSSAHLRSRDVRSCTAHRTKTQHSCTFTACSHNPTLHS